MLKYLIEQEEYEQPIGVYYTNCGSWTDDPYNAMRFNTEREAKELMSNIIFDRIVVVTEHIFE